MQHKSWYKKGLLGMYAKKNLGYPVCIPTHLIRNNTITNYELRILAALLAYKKDRYPSAYRLSKETGICLRWVKHVLKTLIAKGLLFRTPRGSKRYNYHFGFDHKDKTKGVTYIPSGAIRSKYLDAHDFGVLAAILSFSPSFPSYECLAAMRGICRVRVWKSLRTLEDLGIIKRFKKKPKSVQYIAGWASESTYPNTKPLRFGNTSLVHGKNRYEQKMHKMNEGSEQSKLISGHSVNSNYYKNQYKIIKDSIPLGLLAAKALGKLHDEGGLWSG